jgi:hypothetical protein
VDLRRRKLSTGSCWQHSGEGQRRQQRAEGLGECLKVSGVQRPWQHARPGVGGRVFQVA